MLVTAAAAKLFTCENVHVAKEVLLLQTHQLLCLQIMIHSVLVFATEVTEVIRRKVTVKKFIYE